MIRCGSTKESGFKLTKDNDVLHLQPFLCLHVPFLSLTSSVFPNIHLCLFSPYIKSPGCVMMLK